MNKDNKWMLMTYYCPTHGDLGRMETFEIQREDISKVFLKDKENFRKIEKFD